MKIKLLPETLNFINTYTSKIVTHIFKIVAIEQLISSAKRLILNLHLSL